DREKSLKLFEAGFRHTKQLKDRDPNRVLETGEVGLLFICTNCGSFVASGDAKCPRCAAEFEPEPAATVPVEEDILDILLCPVCGADYDLGTAECEVCGEALKETEKPEIVAPKGVPAVPPAAEAARVETALDRVDDFLKESDLPAMATPRPAAERPAATRPERPHPIPTPKPPAPIPSAPPAVRPPPAAGRVKPPLDRVDDFLTESDRPAMATPRPAAERPAATRPERPHPIPTPKPPAPIPSAPPQPRPKSTPGPARVEPKLAATPAPTPPPTPTRTKPPSPRPPTPVVPERPKPAAPKKTAPVSVRETIAVPSAPKTRKRTQRSSRMASEKVRRKPPATRRISAETAGSLVVAAAASLL